MNTQEEGISDQPQARSTGALSALNLTPAQNRELQLAYAKATSPTAMHRTNVLMHLGRGWSPEQVAEFYGAEITRQVTQRYVEAWHSGGLTGLLEAVVPNEGFPAGAGTATKG